MRKAISYWSLKDGLAGTQPLDDSGLYEAREAGFSCLELSIGTEGVLTVDTSESACELIRKNIEMAGFSYETLASGMTWGCNPVSNDLEVRETAIVLNKKALQRASWLGCDAMLFVPGVVTSPIAPDERVRYDEALERCRICVSELLETAEQVGVDLCMENVWNGFFYSPVELAGFVDSFSSSRLGVYFDVGNVIGYHQYPPHWIELLGERIKRVHIKDFRHNFDWNGSYSFCELGEGDVPWEETIQALQNIGYDKTIVAEMLPYSPGLLERTSAAMDRILGQETLAISTNGKTVLQ